MTSALHVAVVADRDHGQSRLGPRQRPVVSHALRQLAPPLEGLTGRPRGLAAEPQAAQRHPGLGERGVVAGAARQEPLEVRRALDEHAAYGPVAGEQRGHLQARRLVLLGEPRERRPQVRVLRWPEPDRLVTAAGGGRRRRLPDEVQVPPGVPLAQRAQRLGAPLEPARRGGGQVGVEGVAARGGEDEPAVVDEVGQVPAAHARHVGSRPEREAPAEHAQPRRRGARPGRQRPPRRRHDARQRPVALGRVDAGRPEAVGLLLESRGEVGGGHSPEGRRRHLDGQREAADRAADPHQRAAVVDEPGRPGGAGARQQELHRRGARGAGPRLVLLGHGQAAEPHYVLGREPEAHARGHEELRVLDRLDQGGEPRGGGRELLHVVEHDERAPARQRRADLRPCVLARRPRADRARHGEGQLVGVGDRLEAHHVRAVGEDPLRPQFREHLLREPGLSHAARSEDRDEPDVVALHQRAEEGVLPVAPEVSARPLPRRGRRRCAHLLQRPAHLVRERVPGGAQDGPQPVEHGRLGRRRAGHPPGLGREGPGARGLARRGAPFRLLQEGRLQRARQPLARGQQPLLELRRHARDVHADAEGPGVEPSCGVEVAGRERLLQLDGVAGGAARH